MRCPTSLSQPRRPGLDDKKKHKSKKAKSVAFACPASPPPPLAAAGPPLPDGAAECAKRAMALACAALLHNITEQGGRTQSTIFDAEEAFHEMKGIEMETLPRSVRARIEASRLVLLVPGALPVTALPDHIPSWAPPLYSQKLNFVDPFAPVPEPVAEPPIPVDDFPDFMGADVRSLGILPDPRTALVAPIRVRKNLPLTVDTSYTQVSIQMLERDADQEHPDTLKAPVLRIKIMKPTSFDVSSPMNSPALPVPPMSAPPVHSMTGAADTWTNSPQLPTKPMISPLIASSATNSGRSTPLHHPFTPSNAQPPLGLGQPITTSNAVPAKKRGRPPKKGGAAASRRGSVVDDPNELSPAIASIVQAINDDVARQLRGFSPLAAASPTYSSQPATPTTPSAAPKKVIRRASYVPPVAPMVLPARANRGQNPRNLSPPLATPTTPATPKEKKKFVEKPQAFPPMILKLPAWPKAQPAPPPPPAPAAAPPPAPLILKFPPIAVAVPPPQVVTQSPARPLPAPIPQESPSGYHLPRRQHQPPKKFQDFESDLPPSLGGRKRGPSEAVEPSPTIRAPTTKKARLDTPQATPSARGSLTKKRGRGRPAGVAGRAAVPSPPKQTVPKLRLIIPRTTVEEREDDDEEEEEFEDDVEEDEEPEAPPARLPLKLRISFGCDRIGDGAQNSPEPRVALNIDLGQRFGFTGTVNGDGGDEGEVDGREADGPATERIDKRAKPVEDQQGRDVVVNALMDELLDRISAQ
ncbi:unnamed protein product, partial [Mesorhabditis spiculigera]